MDDDAPLGLDAPVRSSAVEQVRAAIGDLVSRGRFGSVGRLPSERDLARELGASRSTVRAALLALAEEGVLAASPQSGWFVSAAPLSEPPRALISFTEMARRRGVETHSRVVGHRVREATYDEARELRVPPLSAVLDLERVRTLGAAPVCHDRTVASLVRVPGLDAVDFTDASLFTAMEELGVRPVRSDYAVEAAGADERTAALLDVAAGAPVLVGSETSLDRVGRPLMLGRVVYRANAYRFYATLLRR